MPRQPTGRPTGRPKGSGQLGSETQGTQTRLTVRLPQDLYDRLDAFAEGHTSFTHGAPRLALCVREALAHYLICPKIRQTENAPYATECSNGQTESDARAWAAVPQDLQAAMHTQAQQRGLTLATFLARCLDLDADTAGQCIDEDGMRQTKSSPACTAQDSLEQDIRLPENSTASVLTPTDNKRQTKNNQTQACVQGSEIIWQTESVSPFDPTKYVLGKLCPRGHDYHGSGRTLLRISGHRCMQCEAEKKRERRQRLRLVTVPRTTEE
jgi:hypothetical protein